MTIELWNQLHKDMSMPTDKDKHESKAKTVLVTTNIGTNDLRTFGIQEAYQDGELVTLNCDCADKMIRAGVAIEYTDEVKKAREDEQKRVLDANVAAATPIAQRELAVEAAKEEAKKHLKEGAKSQTPKVATQKGDGPLPVASEEGAPILKARAGGSAPAVNEPSEPKKP